MAQPAASAAASRWSSGPSDAPGTGTRTRCALVAGAIGALAGWAFYAAWPAPLRVTTDVVGYPIWADFNIDRYYHLYEAVAVVFPIVAFTVYALLVRLALPGNVPAPPASDPPPRWTPLVGLARVGLVGTLLGLETAIAVGVLRWRFWGIVAAVAALYAVVLGLGARIGGARDRVAWWNAVAWQNTAASPLVLLGLWGVSYGTRAIFLETGAVRSLAWLPAWLAFAMTVVAAAILARPLARARGAETRRLERQAMLALVGPVAVFILWSSVPPALGPMDYFHEGEALVAADLVHRGWFPWRDVIFIHGLTEDVFRPLTGLLLFDYTRWGVAAGMAILLRPLVFVGLYALYAYVFGASWPFLVLTVVAPLLGIADHIHWRMVLQPFVLLALAALLAKARPLRALVFVTLLLVQAICTPETTYLALACALVLVAYEAWEAPRDTSWWARFRRTRWCAAFGLVLSGAFLAFLWRHDAIGGWLDYYKTFAPDHRLMAGIPVSPRGDAVTSFWLVALAPVPCMLVVWAYVATRIRARASLARPEWIVLAASIFCLFYYQKFLGRADQHAYHVTFSVTVVIWFAIWTGVQALDRRLARRPVALLRWTTHPAALALLLAAIAAAPVRPLSAVTRLAWQLQQKLPVPPTTPPRVGPSRADAFDDPAWPDYVAAFAAYVRPGDRVFDFSTAPAFFYWTLGLQPVTRYYHASMAMREVAMHDLVAQLEAARPEFVVYYHDRNGLGAWDGIESMVRHYEVSHYLLLHYRPVVAIHGTVLMARNDLPVPTTPPPGLHGLTTDGLYFSVACDWGRAPNFLRIRHVDAAIAARAIDVPFETVPDGLLQVTGWAGDPDAKRPAAAVLLVRDGRVLSHLAVDRSRPDVTAALADGHFEQSGFDTVLPVPRGSEPDIRVFALSVSGVATELPGDLPPGPPLDTLDDPALGTIRVGPGRMLGHVDRRSVRPAIAMHVPESARKAGYGLLALDVQPWRDEPFEFFDTSGSGGPTHVIRFASLPEAHDPFVVPVGACSQWTGYAGDTLYLQTPRLDAVRSIRLLPGPAEPSTFASAGIS